MPDSAKSFCAFILAEIVAGILWITGARWVINKIMRRKNEKAFMGC